jgi:hypothetical protein
VAFETLLIDGIGPFFRHNDRKRINWSKIPFADIERDDSLRDDYRATVPDDFRRLTATVAALGYTAVTLDDVAHLVVDADYPAALKRKLEQYRTLYRELFAMAAEAGLQVYVTTDLMFYNDTLRAKLGHRLERALDWLVPALDGLFRDFPEVAGVIVRIGETDGVDVAGDFRSRMLLRKPWQARRFLERLLPTFEAHGRTLVFRTWSVGAHSIGDLIWNPRTFDRVFGGIESRSLVISMKYGETDFFRHLPLNPLFFHSEHRKLVEFQARREYEGFGAYPSFVGWDCERHVAQLRGARNVVGFSVWCQTGGWGKRRQLTFLRNSSPWVELNVFVVGRLFAGETCDEAITDHARRHGYDPAVWRHFLELSDVVVKDLLYVRELAQRQLFFRRLRLPPQLMVFWDRILVSHTIKRILRCLVSDSAACLEQGRHALALLAEMRRLAEEHHLPTKGLAFQHRTFEILAAAREYFFQPFTPELAQRLVSLRDHYRFEYRRHYTLLLDFGEGRIPSYRIRWALAVLLRHHRDYRTLDQVATLHLLAWFYPLLARLQRRVVPDFANHTAMGLDAVFR